MAFGPFTVYEHTISELVKKSGKRLNLSCGTGVCVKDDRDRGLLSKNLRIEKNLNLVLQVIRSCEFFDKDLPVQSHKLQRFCIEE